jgi:hypothetical protein
VTRRGASINDKGDCKNIDVRFSGNKAVHNIGLLNICIDWPPP